MLPAPSTFHSPAIFAQVDAIFAQVDAIFAQVDAIFAQVDAIVTDPANKVRAGISNIMADTLLITSQI